jgi:hypothetical protein
MARAIVKQKEIFTGPQLTTSGGTPITSTGVWTTFDISPTLTFVPISSGQYKISTIATGEQTGSPIASIMRLRSTAGGGTLLNESQSCSDIGGGTTIAAYPLWAVYQLTAGVSYSFDIQGQNFNAGGNLFITGIEASFSIQAQQVV